MYRPPLTTRLAVVALVVTATAPAAHGHGRASWNVQYPEQVMVFPDTEHHVTMIADLHTHTVFSDGHVWPNIRVAEALRDGLDAVAITDHLEYQPHRALVPNPDRNAAVTEARMAAAGQPPVTFRHEGFPAFTIEFPAGTRETAPDGPTQVFAASTPDGVTFQVSVTDFPAGILLPIEKAAEYFIELTAASGIGSDFEVTRNEEMTLGDGSPAYRSEVTWLYLPAAVTFETQIVSAYRGGRLVSVTAHPRQSSEHISKLVESLRFP